MPRRNPSTSSKPVSSLARSLRSDGWANLMTGLADVKRDKRVHAFAHTAVRGYHELRNLYDSDDMAAKIVDDFADELVREWLDVQIVDETAKAPAGQVPNAAAKSPSKDTEEAVAAKLEELHAQERVCEAVKHARAYGGGGILIGADDGVGLDGLRLPLNETAIKAVRYLTTFDASELVAVDYYDNPLDAKYGEPSVYQLQPRTSGRATIGVVQVHETRILRFSGPVISRDLMLRNYGWGKSTIDRVHDVLRDFGLAWEGAGALMQDFAQAVIKIRGLADAVASDRDELVLKRMQIMDLNRSVIRSLLLDAEGEDFERKSTPVTGLPDMLDRFCNRLAAASGMPVTRLMGQSPAGLNATGDSDIRNWYAQLRSTQTRWVGPRVERLVRLIMLSKEGPTKGVEPERWSVNWRPLWAPTQKEVAETRKTQADADVAYINAGVLVPEEVAKSRFGGDAYSIETRLDQGARDAFAEQQTAQLAAEAEAAAANAEALADAQGDEGAQAAQGGKPGVAA